MSGTGLELAVHTETFQVRLTGPAQRGPRGVPLVEGDVDGEVQAQLRREEADEERGEVAVAPADAAIAWRERGTQFRTRATAIAAGGQTRRVRCGGGALSAQEAGKSELPDLVACFSV